jgi:hypothetical protein
VAKKPNILNAAGDIYRMEVKLAQQVGEHIRSCLYCTDTIVGFGYEPEEIFGTVEESKDYSDELVEKLYRCPDFPYGVNVPRRFPPRRSRRT